MKYTAKKRKFLPGRFMQDVSAWVLIAPALCALMLICWRPIFLGFKMAFFDNDGLKYVGLDNFKLVVSDVLFIKALKNTTLYVVWSLIIGMGLPVVVALLMNELIHATSLIKSSLYLPQIVPVIAVSLLWYFVYLPDGSGLLNSILGLFGLSPRVWLQDARLTIPLIIISMTWRGFGFTSILYLASLQGINRELYEAAAIDGAGFLRRTVKITIPHMYPMIMLFGINQIKSIFNIMVEPLSMTGGGPDNASLSLGLQSYRYAFQYFRMGESVALSIVMWFIIMGVTVIYIYADKKLEQ